MAWEGWRREVSPYLDWQSEHGAMLGKEGVHLDRSHGRLVSLLAYGWEVRSLQQGVWCEPDFRDRIPSMTLGISPTLSDRRSTGRRVKATGGVDGCSIVFALARTRYQTQWAVLAVASALSYPGAITILTATTLEMIPICSPAPEVPTRREFTTAARDGHRTRQLRLWAFLNR